MIPLRDEQPLNSFPIVTILLIAANIVVYYFEQTVPGLTQSYSMVPYEVVHRTALSGVVGHFFPNGSVRLMQPPPGANISLGGNDIYYGFPPHPVWLTIFSSMFLHANLLHIGGNMLFLWIFGNNVEDALGKLRFLFFYFACGLAAAIMQIASSPDSLIPTLGASGAIAGTLGAYLILYPGARVLTLVPFFVFFLARIRAVWVILAWVVYDILPAFLSSGPGGGVAYFAHLGGFVAGFVLIYLMGGRQLAATRRVPSTYRPPPTGWR